MACQIKTDENNNIIRVDAENGKQSILFSAINSNPHLTPGQALETYKNTYTENFPLTRDDRNGESRLFYKTPNGDLYTDFAEALQNTSDGEIEAVSLSRKEGNPNFTFFTVNSNTNPDTLGGFINQQIKKGHISGKSITIDGIKKLQGAGESIQAKYNNARLALSDTTRQGKLNADGTIDIQEPAASSKKQIVKAVKSGKTSGIKLPIAPLAYSVFREENDLYSKDKQYVQEQLNLLSEKQLVSSLQTFLNKMGVNLTSVNSYIEVFKNKNGQEPTAEALADIANKTVAFSEGQLTAENLSEETAHFAIEAFQDQDMLDRVLNTVHLTDEWKTDAQRYLEVYGKNYKGVELDAIVRREILGKILAKKFKSNFTENNNSDVDPGITNLLLKMWVNLVNRIRQIITPALKSELNTLTDNIANNVLNSNFDEFSTELLDKNEFVYYSLPDKRVISSLNKSLDALRKESARLKKTNTGNFDTAVRQLEEKLSNDIGDKEAWMAVQILSSSTAKHINTLKNIVNSELKKLETGDNNGNKLFLNAEESIAIDNLSDIRKTLQEVLTTIKSNKLPKVSEIQNTDAIVKDLEKRVQDIDYLQSSSSQLKSEGFENVIDKFMAEYGVLNNVTRQEILDLIKQEVDDISMFSKYYGGLQYVNNQVARIIGYKIAEIRLNATSSTQQEIQPLLSKLQENGVNYEITKTLVELDNTGSATGNTISPVRLEEYERNLENAKLLAKSVALKLDIDDLEALRKLKLKKQGDFTTQELYDYNKEMESWSRLNDESPLSEEALQEIDKRNEGLSPITKEALKDISSRRAKIMRKYINSQGNVDYTTNKLSSIDEIEIQSLNQERAALKSILYADGTQKEVEALQIARELQKKDEGFLADKETKNIKDSFKQTLVELENSDIDEIEGNKQSLRTVKLSGGLIFSQNFFGEKSVIGSDPKIVQTIKALGDIKIGGVSSEYFAELVKEKLETRSELLRMFRKVGSPSETDVAAMPEITKERIKQLDDELSALFLEANQTLRKNSQEEIKTIETENTVNKAYREDLLDSGVKESEIGTDKELTFIRRNSSKKANNDLDNLDRKILDLLVGNTDNIEPKYRRIFSQALNIDEELDNNDFLDEVQTKLEEVSTLDILISYGKTQVYSYYKRYAPKGYETFERDLEAGFVKPSDLLNDDTKQKLIDKYPAVEFVEISPNYLFTENKDENKINPNYNPNWEGGFRQPKMALYRNDNYFNRFKPNSEGKATTNTKDFEVLELMWDAKRKIDEKYNNRRNIYKLPQISKTSVEKIVEAGRIGVVESAKRAVADKFLVKVDEIDYGQQNELGQDIIPKRFVQDLEEKSDVSLNIAATYTRMLHEANRYDEKQKVFQDIQYLQQGILDTKFSNGKTGDNSNIAQMVKEQIDANIYDKTSNTKVIKNVLGYKVDLSRLSAVFDKFLRGVKLKFNAPVAFTNFFTNVVSKNIESSLGQYINNNSSNYATKTFLSKYAGGMINQAGKIVRDNKMYLFLERAGINDLEDKLANSSFPRTIRVLDDLGWSLMHLGDQAIKSQVVLSVLDDMRNVEGTFMNLKTFTNRTENEGLSKAAIIEKWNNEYRSQSLENLIEVVDGKLTFNPETIKQFGQEVLNNKLTQTMLLARRTAGKIDSQVLPEDKSAMSRHILGRYTLGMRGFLVSTIDRKFSKREYNFLTEQFEEGSFVTGANFINSTIGKVIQDKNMMKLMSVVKEEWSNLDDNQKMNMKRTLLEFSVFLAMCAIGVALVGYSDDDDQKDNWTLQAATYLYLRVTSESSSGNIGLPSQILDVLEKPFLTVSILKQTIGAKWTGTAGEGSKFAGTSNFVALLMKQSSLSNLESLGNINRTSDRYRQANAATLWFLAKNKENEEFDDTFKAE